MGGKWVVIPAAVIAIAASLLPNAARPAGAAPVAAVASRELAARPGSHPALTPTVPAPAAAARRANAPSVHPAKAESPATLGQTIASIAEGQEGYLDSPPSGYCNKYSAQMGTGTPCGSGLRSEFWCADFAAWVWRQAGVSFSYPATLNARAASFITWGKANGTWHPLSSSYTPQPGDAAVYGVTQGEGYDHVAIVVGGGWDSPNVVNGDFYTTNASRIGVYYVADETSSYYTSAAGGLDGYVSPAGGSSASAPGAPTSVSATPGGQGFATVSWQPPASDGGSAITAYNVTSNPPAVSLWYDPSYNSVVLDGLTTGVSYTFTVTAANAVGTSAPSAPSNAITPYTWPDPPPITNVVSGDGQATVYFDPPANDGYSPITSYQVTAGLYGSESGLTASGTGSPITVTGLTDGDSYWVYVVAFNAGGNSASSPVDGNATPLAQSTPAGDVFVAEPAGDQVTEITAGGTRKTIGSGFSAPNDVAVDASGDVFVADTGNNRVVEVAADGTQTTIGTGFSSPDGVAVDGSGDVYVADTGNNRVVEIAPGGTQTTIGSGLRAPRAVAIDASGDVFVADTGNSRIVEFPAAAGQPVTQQTGVTDADYLGVTWDGGTQPSATGIAVDWAGDQYYPDSSSGRILMQGGAGHLTSVATGLGDAAGMAVLSPPPPPGWVGSTAGDASVTVQFDPPAGTVGYSPVTGYQVTCQDLTSTANSATVVTAASSPVTVTGLVNGDNYGCGVTAVNAIGGGAARELGVVTPTAPGTPSANVFFADYYNNQVLEVSANSGVPSVTLATGLDGPEYVAVDSRGDAYVGDVPAHQVLFFPAGGGQPNIVASGIYGMFGLALDASGNLYVGGSTTAGGGIGTPDYVYEYPAGGGASRTVATDTNAPQALAVNPATGDIYMLDTSNLVEQPASGGPLVTLATGVLGNGLAVDAQGDVYYTNINEPGDVYKRAAGTGTVTTVGSGFQYPEGVAVDSAGNVYVSDTFNNRVIEVPANGGPQFTVETAVDMPAGLTVQTPALPSPPSAISVSTDNAFQDVSVTWSPPVSTGASAISGYLVSVTGPSGTPVIPPVQVPGNSLSYTFRNDLPAGQRLTLTVQSENIDGASPGISASAMLTPLVAQTIDFSAPQTGTVGGTATLTAAGGASGNPVAFTVDPASTTGACALSGSYGTTVSYHGIGSCVIDANQAGSDSYSAAPQAQQIITVGPGSQQLTVTAPASGSFGGTATLSGTGGNSGSPVVFTVDAASWTGTCAVSGTNGTKLTYTGVGTCVIDANQAGTANYTAAPQVQKVITVKPAGQQISFTAPSAGTVGGSVTLSATGGKSASPVRFTIDEATGSGICSVSGMNGTKLSYQGAGTCIVDANQAGNAGPGNAPTYSAAPQVRREITVKKAATKTGLTLSAGTVTYGHEQSAKLTVAVTFTGSAPAPTGTVTVKAGGTTLCTIRLSAGRGSCTLSASRLKPGTYHLVASYGGSANFASSTATAKTLVVKG